jgi:hypothetical protein
MSIKPTPSPWTIRAAKDEGCSVIQDAHGWSIAHLCGRWSNAKANESLIAAAPDMANALLYVLDCIARDDVTDMQPVREALAKAGL